MDPRPPVLVGLYVPGDRPDRFAKALSAGADQAIIDLEDAVAPGTKPRPERRWQPFLAGRYRSGGGTAERGGYAVVRGRFWPCWPRPRTGPRWTAQDRGTRGC